MPLYFRLWAFPSGSDTTVRVAVAQKEESRVPYNRQIAYSGPKSAAPNSSYGIFRNGELLYEGRTDKDGFAKAMNADYLEQWELRVYR